MRRVCSTRPDPGQGVAHRGVFQLLGVTAAIDQRAVVVEGFDRADDRAGPVTQRRGAHADGLAVPVLVAQEDMRLTLAPIADRGQQRAEAAAQLRARVIAMVEDVVATAAPEDLFTSEASDLLGTLVPIQNPSLTIDELHTVAEVLQHSRTQLLVKFHRQPDSGRLRSHHRASRPGLTSP